MTLTEQVSLLARLREELTKLQATKKISYEQWLRVNKELLDEIAGLNLEVDTAEELTKEEALKIFISDGNRHPAPGVEIKEFSRLIYDDRKAFEWALKHQVALSLDRKTFEKVAKTTPIEFVTTVSSPKALIAQDLNKVLTGMHHDPIES